MDRTHNQAVIKKISMILQDFKQQSCDLPTNILLINVLALKINVKHLHLPTNIPQK